MKSRTTQFIIVLLLIMKTNQIAISNLLNKDESCEHKSTMKPLRKRIGRDQIIQLQEIFENGIKMPDKDLREKLSEKLGLTTRTIQVWFQNRRQNKKSSEFQSDLQMASILQSLKLAVK